MYIICMIFFILDQMMNLNFHDQNIFFIIIINNLIPNSLLLV